MASSSRSLRWAIQPAPAKLTSQPTRAIRIPIWPAARSSRSASAAAAEPTIASWASARRLIPAPKRTPLRNRGRPPAQAGPVSGGRHLDRCARVGTDLLERDARRQLQRMKGGANLAVHLEYPEFGHDRVDHAGSGQRQVATLEQLLLALGGVFHEHDHALDPGHQVHGAAHAFD